MLNFDTIFHGSQKSNTKNTASSKAFLYFLFSFVFLFSSSFVFQFAFYDAYAAPNQQNGTRTCSEGTINLYTKHKAPDLYPNVTHETVRSGNWSNPTVWVGGQIPGDEATVRIAAGTTVTYDISEGELEHANLKTLSIHGELNFSRTKNTNLSSWYIFVAPQGYLEVGTASNPIPENITSSISILNLPFDLNCDPEQYAPGLVVTGKMHVSGAPMNKTFTRLSSAPRAGDTSLVLSEATPSWKVGDRIFVPGTNHITLSSLRAGAKFEFEERVIKSLSNGNKTILLNQPLTYDHFGSKNMDGVTEFLPHVGNLTRNVVFESENPAGVLGHIIMIGKSEVDARYATIREMGRTTFNRLNSTTLNADNSAVSIGTNQIGRYAFHFHHYWGPDQPLANGKQVNVIGLAFDGGSVDHNRKWDLTIHNTHYGLFKDNVIYNYGGAGITTEDGSESFNTIENNFVVRGNARGASNSRGGSDTGHEGDGIWLRAGNNYVQNNVVANSRNYGINIYTQWAGTKAIPTVQGGDSENPTHSAKKNLYTLPIIHGGLVGNEVYASDGGMSWWWLGTEGQNGAPDPNIAQSVIKDFTSWNNRLGMFGYQSYNLKIKNSVVRGPGITNEATFAFAFADYLQEKMIISGANVQNTQNGMDLPVLSTTRLNSGGDEGLFVLENSFFRVHGYGVSNVNAWHNNSGHGIGQNKSVIRNTRIEAGGDEISMLFLDAPHRQSSHIANDQVFVYDYQGVLGDDFQVFFSQQAQTGILPLSRYRHFGGESYATDLNGYFLEVTEGVPYDPRLGDPYNSATPALDPNGVAIPIEGLPNFEALLLYDTNALTRLNARPALRVVAGALAPCEDTRKGIDGFVCAVGATVEEFQSFTSNSAKGAEDSSATNIEQEQNNTVSPPLVNSGNIHDSATEIVDNNIDSDNDGFSDNKEHKLGTDPNRKDTDGDGIFDFDEIAQGTDPLNPPDNINTSFTQRHKGKIFLQVEQRGEAWYIHPDTLTRIYLRDGNATYQIMRLLSHGVTKENFQKLQAGDQNLTNLFRGKIALVVDDLGKAYYVDPTDDSIHYLADGPSAYNLLRERGIGIINADIRRVRYDDFHVGEIE